MFGSESRKANSGRTIWKECSAHEVEKPIQAEQFGRNVRLRKQKGQFGPNMGAKMHGQEIKNIKYSRTGAEKLHRKLKKYSREIGNDFPAVCL